MTDTRIRRLQQDLNDYASSDTLDLTLDSSGVYDPQFTEPSPWGQPQQRSAAAPTTEAREVTPASATPSATPKPRRRWPGGGSPSPAPTPEPPSAPAETTVAVPRNPQPPAAEEPRKTWTEALSVGPRPKLKINRTVRRLGQDLPWCAVAIWLHLLTAGRPLMTTLVTAGLYIAILFWIWLILKNGDDKVPAAIGAAVALSSVPVQQPLLCGATFLASYLLGGEPSHQGWPLVLSRVLVPIILSWPLAAILVWFKLFG